MRLTVLYVGMLAALVITGIICRPAQAGEKFRKTETIQANGGPNVTLLLYTSADESTIEFRARNNDATPYGIQVSLDLDNMQSSVPLPYTGTLEPDRWREKTLFRISRIDADQPYYYRNFSWHLSSTPLTGDKPVVHTGTYAYPWPKKRSFTVDNAFNGYGAHQGVWAYGVDFKMPVGSPIAAAREGTVVAVQTRYTKGGNDPSLADKANYVFIRHPDGSIGRYLHIRQNGALVNVGQKVRSGDQIALSGNVGWSTDPHLHFDVVVPDGEQGQKTIPFKFRRPDGSTFEPTLGMRLSH